MSLRFTTLHYIKQHYTTFPYTTLHYITLHYTTYTTLHSLPLHFTTLHYTPLHYNYNYNYTTTLHYTPLHYTTLHYTTLHYTTLHSTTLIPFQLLLFPWCPLPLSLWWFPRTCWFAQRQIKQLHTHVRTYMIMLYSCKCIYFYFDKKWYLVHLFSYLCVWVLLMWIICDCSCVPDHESRGRILYGLLTTPGRTNGAPSISRTGCTHALLWN